MCDLPCVVKSAVTETIIWKEKPIITKTFLLHLWWPKLFSALHFCLIYFAPLIFCAIYISLFSLNFFISLKIYEARIFKLYINHWSRHSSFLSTDFMFLYWFRDLKCTFRVGIFYLRRGSKPYILTRLDMDHSSSYPFICLSQAQ